MDANGLLQTAESIARGAGDILRNGSLHLREVHFQDQRDVKLRADMESEEWIRARLGEAAPFPVYGEELGGDAGLLEKDEPFWVVDPLDGTYNYLRGSEICCVSIGLMRGVEPVLGVIYNFNTNMCYTGRAHEELLVNGEPVTPNWADQMDQAALVTGFPAGMNRSEQGMRSFMERIGPFKKVRMVGSAAMAMAYVAGGIFDVYYEEGIRLWDVAAGLSLITAAGGKVRLDPSDSGKELAYNVWAGKGEFLGA